MLLGLFVVNLSSGILPDRINRSHSSSALISSESINSKISFCNGDKGAGTLHTSATSTFSFLLQINLQMKFDSLHLFLSND